MRVFLLTWFVKAFQDRDPVLYFFNPLAPYHYLLMA